MEIKPVPVEASYEKEWAGNWEHIGTVFIEEGKVPEFVSINGVTCERKG